MREAMTSGPTAAFERRFLSLPPALGIALKLAYGVVVCELLAISFIRYRFTGDVQVIIGGGIAFAIGPFGRIGARLRASGVNRTGKRCCHESRIHRIGAHGRRHGGEPIEGRP